MNIKSQNQAVGTIVIAIETAMANENLTAAQSLFGHLRKAIFPYECVTHDRGGELVVGGWLSTEKSLREEYTDQMLRYELDSGLWIEDDGGRRICGYNDSASDCCVRAISIGMEKIYDDIWVFFKQLSGLSPDEGVSDIHVCNYIANAGWNRKFYDDGTKVIDVIPKEGNSIIWCRFLDGLHAVASVDGKIRDTFNSLGFEVLWVATPPE